MIYDIIILSEKLLICIQLLLLSSIIQEYKINLSINFIYLYWINKFYFYYILVCKIIIL